MMIRILRRLRSYILILPFLLIRNKAKFIAITGTDGKTTSSTLLYNMFLKEGFKVACFTTIGIFYNDGFIQSGLHTTTPSAYDLRKKLFLFRNYDYIIIETTSIGIDQGRIAGLRFDAILYTNITLDHLDYHKTWERYAYVKSSLQKYLKRTGFAIINKDDKKSFEFLSKQFKTIKYYTYSIYDSASDIHAFNVTKDSFDVKFIKSTYSFKTKLLGEYNIQNSILCIATALKFNISENSISEVLKNPPVISGRFEIVSQEPFIVVDFAHTPNAILNVLETLDKMRKKDTSRIITLFGAPGERDKFKRPKMGENAALFSDIIIITADDPRFDDQKEIYKDIIKNIDTTIFRENVNIFRIDDRGSAIDFAMDLSNKDDIIALLGKGHERSLAIKGKEIPWSDKEYILKKVKHGKK